MQAQSKASASLPYKNSLQTQAKDAMNFFSRKPLMGVLLASLLMHASLVHSQIGTAQLTELPSSAPTSILIKEIADHAELMKNLETICDDVGPRLTGSQQLRTAQAWAMEKLNAYGAVDVHEEAYDLGRPWQRGIARAHLVNANGIALDIVQKAWTVGTNGVIRADVALLDVKTLDEFNAVAPTLRGKIVLVISGPKATPEQNKNIKQYSAEVNRAIHEAHFAAVLLTSDKDNGLQNMWGSPSSRFDRNAGIITSENANLLKRLLARGITPKLEMELTGNFSKESVKAYNVVADFKGTEAADEMVIIGAHLDSWDLGTGATDNGTGVVVAMEILRAMHAQGLHPKRSLRVVLFSGEEQGLLGSKAYLVKHREELAKIQAIIVQDAGSGRIMGFPDMKVEAWYTALTAAIAPAKELGAQDVIYAIGNGSDHDVFFEQGIPAFTPMQDPLDYRSHTHHSQVDTVDHVVLADLMQSAQVMAITVWGLLNGERLPHQEQSEKH
ncbi:M20/M25/M40 family metallo-hydrolase [Solimicrobium silvestre]|uniref:Carboxypeptidase Q n=1 Tax=Solimicrobium silvestre TaxID=2099400 RepID=A0A2S9H3Z9_9BURK|nr:M20/M25/M40 family metallo-hydrolase [Solimicrobium silvestre]PRC94596.1 Peptidase family M28 [Solimicrobium silvestre]